MSSEITNQKITVTIGTTVTHRDMVFRVVAIDTETNGVSLLNETSGKTGDMDLDVFQELLQNSYGQMKVNQAPESTNIEDQVEDQLRKKQAGKYFKDTGERISGSRKEMAAYKKLVTVADLMSFDNATAFEMVKKDKVLGAYDAKADIESGTSGGAVYMKKQLFSAIPTKPEDSAEGRRVYVEKIPELWNEILAMKDYETLSEFGRARFMSSYSSRN